MHLHALHRNPDYWEDPNTFKPERFLSANAKLFPYLPFGERIQASTAANFILLELTLTAALLVKHVHFSMKDPVHEESLFFSFRQPNIEGIHVQKTLKSF